MNNGFRRLTILTAWALFAFFGVLILSLSGFVTPARLVAVATSPRVLFSMKISVGAAMLATLLSLAVAIPTGYALSRFEFFGKRAIDLALEIPMVVTPVALGALLLMFFNTRLGELIQQSRISFVFEFPGIVLAQFVTTVGIATRMLKTTFDEIPARYEAVACTLGATPAQAFRLVTLPMAVPGILAATVLTFAKCIGEFGATIMLAGSMPMKTETLPISIFMRLSGADVEGMAVLILILLGVGLSSLALVKSLIRRSYD
ncbi:MAG: Molybdenum ABC transporter, permease protein ModB [Candidatus Ozemobacter sibiricus]|jgi:molybdate transport system permease protein|uniref:Molybdenum ABC transporter, permease protein ModB n=1 Tax=Candidatus Ozemobacter sibiricus TaxID=2268124 RepID=A0A367ZTS6_9BACT|nr:MAG: Molybdenum ABC transporter, permease protein ModB [Candidatus Ozemobacter sibiricus]